MRKGYDNSVLRTPAGKLIAINFGSDACSEHEWGFDGLRSLLGIDKKNKKIGIGRRATTIVPPKSVLFEDSPMGRAETVLLVGSFLSYATNLAAYVSVDYLSQIELSWPRSYRNNKEEPKPLLTAWSGEAFGLRASTPEDRQAVREIHQALLDKNLALWLGGGQVFQNAGLVVAIVDRIDAASKEKMEEIDLDAVKLVKAAEATGIEKRLIEAGKVFFALSPRWAKGDDKARSKHPVIFWLNPREQHKYNACWATVEDLEDWILNKGPILRLQPRNR